ncbi:MAG: HAMP domain-containing histidine kinase [Chloroflexi bacterium]|nr:HAMP domain-containing histidine kinase [Chloroflexota bacterium]
MAHTIRRVWNPTIQLPFLALLGYAAWLVLAPPSASQELVGAVGLVVARSAAAFALLAAARAQSRQRIWSYLGIGAALWAAASAIDLGIRLTSGEPPVLPSAADLIYLAGYLAALTGVSTYRQQDPERFGRLREILGIAILTLAVGSLDWLIFIRPALAVGFVAPISLIWAAIAPALASILVVLFVQLAMRSTSGGRAGTFLLLSAGAAAFTLADLANAYVRLQNEFTGSGWIEIGWMSAALIMMHVGLRIRAGEAQMNRGRSVIQRVASRIEPMLPLAFTYLVVGSAILGWLLTRQADLLTIAAAATLSLMLVARQGVIIGQRELRQYALELETALSEVAEARGALERFNLRLEQKVGTRTAALEKTVVDLERLNEELKELDQLKSEFVALVSHELRAPLTNIRTGIELILDQEPATGTDRLRIVQGEIERLGALVEAILDYSALDAGRFPLHPQALELAPLTGEIAAQMTDPDRLEIDIPEPLPLLMADERGLKSVLHHLLDNAAKYAPEGELLLQAEAGNGMIRVSLTDSGPGIPADEQDRVFDMFHRLDNRDAREVYGHGLGLPMARKLLEAMGGGIRAEPGENGGSRFVFWLPQAEAR